MLEDIIAVKTTSIFNKMLRTGCCFENVGRQLKLKPHVVPHMKYTPRKCKETGRRLRILLTGKKKGISEPSLLMTKCVRPGEYFKKLEEPRTHENLRWADDIHLSLHDGYLCVTTMQENLFSRWL
ncbi:hypothetical protein GE061_000683 [Apolygus lucorum]|uniref:Uncharacterized protein n=1 Tax=Apolygus lucorum TaxID=248454 RepID=A0A6A4K9I8_APOLU|nr:hypothetical protein GE061_000683 [Apolygus lucorum]